MDLTEMWMPRDLLKIIQEFHDEMARTVSIDWWINY